MNAIVIVPVCISDMSYLFSGYFGLAAMLFLEVSVLLAEVVVRSLTKQYFFS